MVVNYVAILLLLHLWIVVVQGSQYTILSQYMGATVAYEFTNETLVMFRHCLENISVNVCYAEHNLTTIFRVYNKTVARNTSQLNSWCFTCGSNNSNTTIACNRSDSFKPILNPLPMDNRKYNSNCFGKELPNADNSNQCYICSITCQTTFASSQSILSKNTFIATSTATELEEHTSKNNFQNNEDDKTQDNTIKIIIGAVVAVVLVAIIIISVIVYRTHKQKLVDSIISNKDAINCNTTINLSAMDEHGGTSIEAHNGVYMDVFQNLESTTSVLNNEYTYGVVDKHRDSKDSVSVKSNDRVTITSVSNLTYDVMSFTSQKEPLAPAEKPLVASTGEPIYSIVNKSSDTNSETVDKARRNSSKENDYGKLRDPLRKLQNPYDYC